MSADETKSFSDFLRFRCHVSASKSYETEIKLRGPSHQYTTKRVPGEFRLRPRFLIFSRSTAMRQWLLVLATIDNVMHVVSAVDGLSHLIPVWQSTKHRWIHLFLLMAALRRRPTVESSRIPARHFTVGTQRVSSARRRHRAADYQPLLEHDRR